MYGWYHTIYQKYPAINADVDNTINSQVYKPGTACTAGTNAIRAVTQTGLRRYYLGAPENAYVFETAYCAGSYSDDRNIPCTNYSVGSSVSQNGSHYWADLGYVYSWILANYYNPPTGDTQGLFSY
jgi:trimethylamine:corrinoid methyltransferase-like protein